MKGGACQIHPSEGRNRASHEDMNQADYFISVGFTSWGTLTELDSTGPTYRNRENVKR